MANTDPSLPQIDVPRPARSARPESLLPHVPARSASWLIEQRARIRELELEAARLHGQLDASERVERGAQRVCDRLESELQSSRQREATLARALGYAEAERDQLAAVAKQPALAPTRPRAKALPEPGRPETRSRPTGLRRLFGLK